MSYGFSEIDHLLSSSTDPQRGGERYERLGFTVTPLSVITNLGVGNRLLLLRPMTPGTANFFECMGIVDRGRVPASMADLLSGAEGIRSMVLSGADARGSHALLARDGYPFAAPLDIEREWRLPSGEILRPAFLVTLPAPAPLPFNFCQYRTLHYYLREEWLVHANGARHLTGVFALAEEPRTVARYFEAVFSATAVVRNGLYSVGPGKVQLQIGNRAALRALIPDEWLGRLLEPRYLGFEVEVRSLAALRSLLLDRGVRFVEHSDAVVVAPEEACGNVLRFYEARNG
jgi:hypothetical protein